MMVVTVKGLFGGISGLLAIICFCWAALTILAAANSDAPAEDGPNPWWSIGGFLFFLAVMLACIFIR